MKVLDLNNQHNFFQSMCNNLQETMALPCEYSQSITMVISFDQKFNDVKNIK